MEEKIRLNLGCGGEILDGYINCDIDTENKLAQMWFDAKKIPFPDNTVDEIRGYHLIEHFTFQEAMEVLKEWKRALKPGGKVVVETPDFLNTCKRFVDGTEPERVALYGHFFAFPDISPYQVHYFLYTEAQLHWTFTILGFDNMRRLPPDSSYAKQNPNKPDLYLKMEAYKPKNEENK